MTIFLIIFQRRALFVDNFYTYTQVDECSYLIFYFLLLCEMFLFSLTKSSTWELACHGLRAAKVRRKEKSRTYMKKCRHSTWQELAQFFIFRVFSLFDVLTDTARTKRKRKLSHINAGRGECRRRRDLRLHTINSTLLLLFFCVFCYFTTLSPLWHVNNVDFETTFFLLSFWLSRSLCNFHSLTPQAL